MGIPQRLTQAGDSQTDLLEVVGGKVEPQRRAGAGLTGRIEALAAGEQDAPLPGLGDQPLDLIALRQL